MELSQQTPVRPIEPVIPCFVRWAANWVLVYWVDSAWIRKLLGGPVGPGVAEP